MNQNFIDKIIATRPDGTGEVPLVSIITPSYNSEKFILQTINSVISQTFQNWEMLIVDDCSRDNSIHAIKISSSKDTRIKLIQLEQNVGAAEARNIALRIANGRFIAFLDSDDIWLPDKLEKQLQFMSINNLAFTFTAYQIMSVTNTPLKIINVPASINYNQYARNTIIGCLTVIIDKNKTGYFEMPRIKSSHDMALWLLIMKRGFVAYGYNEVLACYRLVPTSNTAKKWKAAKDVWKVYRNVEKISLFKSCYYFICYSFNALKKRL